MNGPPGQNESKKKKRKLDIGTDTIEETMTMNKIKTMEENKVDLVCDITDRYEIKDNGPFIVIMKSTTENTRLSDIKAGKILYESNVNGVLNTTKVNNFSVKVSMKSYKAANELMNNDKLKDVKMYIPTNIITKKGVISDIATDISLKELAEAIHASCPILSVQRLTRRNPEFHKEKDESDNNKKFIPTNKLIILFRAQELPTKVSIFHALRKVEMFKPRVRFCFKCQSYGHTNTDKFPCRFTKVCEFCSSEHEDNKPCVTRCKFCRGNHKSSSRDCSFFEFEERVQLQAYYNNKTTAEVRKEIGVPVRNSYTMLSTQEEFPQVNEKSSELSSEMSSGKNKFPFKRIDERIEQTLKKPKGKEMTFSQVLKTYGSNKNEENFDSSENEDTTNKRVTRSQLQQSLNKKIEQKSSDRQNGESSKSNEKDDPNQSSESENENEKLENEMEFESDEEKNIKIKKNLITSAKGK